jgi:hypothetical protein
MTVYNRLEELLCKSKPRTADQNNTLVNDPHEFDVVSGTGKAVTTRPGNVLFRTVCAFYKESYSKVHTRYEEERPIHDCTVIDKAEFSPKPLSFCFKNRNEQLALARKVLARVLKVNPHVRYLEKQGEQWTDAPHGRCIERFCRALGSGQAGGAKLKATAIVVETPQPPKRSTKTRGVAAITNPDSRARLLDVISQANPRTAAHDQAFVAQPHELDILSGKATGLPFLPGNLVFKTICWLYQKKVSSGMRYGYVCLYYLLVVGTICLFV